MLKRARQVIPKVLEDVVFLDQDIVDEVHVHESFVLTKTIIQELAHFWGDQVRITVDNKGLVLTPQVSMTESEKQWQTERLAEQNSNPDVPSLEEHVGRAYREIWVHTLVNIAKHFDLEKLPSIEVLTLTQAIVAVGEMEKMHLSQIIDFGKDSAVFDYKVFFRKGMLCLMVHVNIKS
jgi:hypothetical protein